jgi:hypothetical protein
MDHELSSALAGVQTGTEHLLAALASSSASSQAALKDLVRADSRLRDSVSRLEEHQALSVELSAINAEAALIEARMGRKARQGVEAEEQLALAIRRAEMLLGKPSTRPLDPAEVCRYAQFVASTTSAPPEWRSWKPLLGDGRALQPQPHPQEVFIPPVGGGPPSLVPCMAQVAWLKKTLAQKERSASVPRDVEALESARKRPRQEPAPKAQPHIQVQQARRVVAGFSDDDDESE